MAAEAKKLITVDDIANLKATTAAGTQWQADHLKAFERDFFTGKCTGSKKLKIKTKNKCVLRLQLMQNSN